MPLSIDATVPRSLYSLLSEKEERRFLRGFGKTIPIFQLNGPGTEN
jgi:hypothetical protein